jgi:hypothetical protein
MHDFPVTQLWWGVAAGVAALAVSLGASVVMARARTADRRPPAIGLPTAAAAMIAIAPPQSPTVGVIVGLAGVTAIVGLAAPTRSRSGTKPVVLTLLLAAPFAWLLAIDASSVAWVRAVGLCGATLGPVAARRTDAEWGRAGLTPGLYAITAAGVFAAVPNTEAAVTLLGAALPGACAGWPLGRARLGGAGAVSATALLVWVAAAGAAGREPAIVGALACLGLLVALPPGLWLAAHSRWATVRRDRRSATGPLAVLVVHAAVVAVASRVAGISHDLRVAVPVAVATLVVAAIAGPALTACVPATAPAGSHPTATPPGSRARCRWPRDHSGFVRLPAVEAMSAPRYEHARKGPSSRRTVVTVARRPSCEAWAHAADPVRFGAHIRALPLGL